MVKGIVLSVFGKTGYIVQKLSCHKKLIKIFQIL